MREAIEKYLNAHGYTSLKPKAAFFDMDGVLFDSMPYHAKSWKMTMSEEGIEEFTEYEAYLNEGRTGHNTIRNAFLRYKGLQISDAEVTRIYDRKCQIFSEISEVKPVADIAELLQRLKRDNVDIYIVTGSGQHSLFQVLDCYFPNIFSADKMITAYDVKHGKPDPEPYLMALKKSGVEPNEAFVVENAPLGVQSSVAAGLFTVVVNTGILNDEDLSVHCDNSGLVFDSVAQVLEHYRGLL